MQYKRHLNKISIVLNIVVIISLFLPFRIRIFFKDLPYEISPLDYGFQLISPIFSVILVTAITVLLLKSKRKRGIIMALTLAFGNILTLIWVRGEIHWQWFWFDYWTKSGIGLIVLSICAIGILAITILKVINLKGLATAKHKYEDIIDSDFQKLK